jgi:hypothetical protein
MCVEDRSLIKYKTWLNKKQLNLTADRALISSSAACLTVVYEFKVNKVMIDSFTNKVILYVNVLDTSMKLRVF